MKKLYTLACLAVMIGMQAFAQVTEPQYIHAQDLKGDYFLIVIGSFTAPYEGDIVIPDTAEYTIPGDTESRQLPVKQIAYEAFRYAQLITSVSIPASIDSIFGNAFADCSGLKKIFYHGTAAQYELMGRDGGCFDFQSSFNVSLYLKADELDNIKSFMEAKGEDAYFANGIFPMGEGEVSIVPEDAGEELKVELTWFLVEDVEEYTLEVSEEDTPKWEYTFDAEGQLLSKTEKSRRNTPAATFETSSSIKIGTASIGPLTPSANYGYKLKGKNAKGETTYAKKGKFSMKKGGDQEPAVIDQTPPEDSEEDISAAIVNTSAKVTKAHKTFINGNLYIQTEDKVYTTCGQQLK